MNLTNVLFAALLMLPLLGIADRLFSPPSKKESTVARWRDYILFAVIAASWGAYTWGPRPRTTIKPFDPRAPVNKYADLNVFISEGKRAEVSPDGKFKVEAEYGVRPLISMGPSGCTVLHLIGPDGTKSRLVGLRESDPGSGLSYSWKWSKDSQAILISGSISGIDCDGRVRPARMPLIYTLEDGSMWDIGRQ